MIFVDTGVLVGAALGSDGLHERSVAVLRSLREQDPVTTDHVIIEAWLVLRRRAGRRQANRFWGSIKGTALEIEAATAMDMERAHSIALLWDDQDFDIVDCTSFAVMERLGIRRAATFDSDFAVYRYGPDRDRAFEIVR